jgi:hypothetical protein
MIQSLSYSIKYNYNLSSFWTGAIAIFITINVLAILHTIAKTYIGYLNRKSSLLFFLNFINIWSLWMFYFLLLISGYWFLFTKTTSSVQVLLPNDQSLYAVFYTLVGLMGIFRLIFVIIDKSDKLGI